MLTINFITIDPAARLSLFSTPTDQSTIQPSLQSIKTRPAKQAKSVNTPCITFRTRCTDLQSEVRDREEFPMEVTTGRCYADAVSRFAGDGRFIEG